jgi:hypothetical protein
MHTVAGPLVVTAFVIIIVVAILILLIGRPILRLTRAAESGESGIMEDNPGPSPQEVRRQKAERLPT